MVLQKVDAALLPSEDDNPLNDEYFIPPPLLLSKSAPVSNTFQHEAVNTPIKLFAPPTEVRRVSLFEFSNHSVS